MTDPIFRPTLRAIMEVTSSITGISTARLDSKQRKREVSYARFAAFVVGYEFGYSTPQIAKRFGNKDHTSVMHGIQKAETCEIHGPAIMKTARAISKSLREGRPYQYEQRALRRKAWLDYLREAKFHAQHCRNRMAAEAHAAAAAAAVETDNPRLTNIQMFIPRTIAVQPHVRAWDLDPEIAARRANYIAMRG